LENEIATLSSKVHNDRDREKKEKKYRRWIPIFMGMTNGSENDKKLLKTMK